MSPSLSVVADNDVKAAAAAASPKGETVAQRVRRLQLEARQLAKDHIKALSAAMVEVETLAAEIAEGANVEGNVHAESLEILGSLVGDAVTQGPIAVRAGAVVRGELRASEVSIEPGSRVSVRLDTQVELDLGAARRR